MATVMTNTFLVHTGDPDSLGTMPTGTSTSSRASAAAVKTKARPGRKHRPQLLGLTAAPCPRLNESSVHCGALGDGMRSVSRVIRRIRAVVQSARQQHMQSGSALVQSFRARLRRRAWQVEKICALHCCLLPLMLYYCITRCMTWVARYSFTTSFRTAVCTLLGYEFSGYTWCTWIMGISLYKCRSSYSLTVIDFLHQLGRTSGGYFRSSVPQLVHDNMAGRIISNSRVGPKSGPYSCSLAVRGLFLCCCSFFCFSLGPPE